MMHGQKNIKSEEHYLAFSVTSPQGTIFHVFSDWHNRIHWRRRVKDGWKEGNCLVVTSQWVI